MLDKYEILVVIIVILLIFYFVITWGAKQKKTSQLPEIKRYLFGVRILITLIAIVALILWFFL